MLTEHEAAGQIGGVHAAELRSALLDTQETLRTEIYGSSEPAVAPTNPMMDDGDATQAKVRCSQVCFLLFEQALLFCRSWTEEIQICMFPHSVWCQENVPLACGT